MKFTTENIRYCLLTHDHSTHTHIKSYADQDLCISGLYLWQRIFNGEFNYVHTPEAMAEYNLLHVNITPNNIPLIPSLLRIIDRSATKLIFNVDHAVDMWNNTFQYPHQFLDTLNVADYIFGVEPTMCNILSSALKRPVPCIPHPVDVEALSALKSGERDTRIGVALHRYDANTVLPWYAVENLPPRWASSAIGAGSPALQNFKMSHLYHELQPYLSFDELVKFISTLYAVIESYTIHSYGRLTVECAALGVPVIGADCVSSQRFLWPSLTIPNFDPVSARDLLFQLINDPSFYQDACQRASSAVSFYSLENSRNRMLKFLNSPQ